MLTSMMTARPRYARQVAAGLIAILFAAACAAGCNQSTPVCRTGSGPYNIQYTLVSGLPSSPCGGLTFDTLGIDSFNAPGEEQKPDVKQVSAALTPGDLAARIDAAEATGWISDASEHPYAGGSFSSAEPQNDFCDIPTLSVATQHLPAIPAVPPDPNGKTCGALQGSPAVAATTITYQWSNWHVYFTPAHAGNQFSIHLKYTVDGSSCEYEGHAALFGNTQSCLLAAPSPPDCKPSPNDVKPQACDAVAHNELGIPKGSGVDPEFPTACDPTTYLCYVPGTVPSLR